MGSSLGIRPYFSIHFNSPRTARNFLPLIKKPQTHFEVLEKTSNRRKGTALQGRWRASIARKAPGFTPDMVRGQPKK